MKTLITVLGLSIFLMAFSQIEKSETRNYPENVKAIEGDSLVYRGKKITPDGAIKASELKAEMGDKKKFNTKVEAIINSCCQKKGCWMKVDLGDGEEMRVTFKDYAFFVPKNSAGQKVVMEGKAYIDETSVDMLRHYAEDAGKSKEEIEAITEPKSELLFEAEGVIIYAD